jgi:branched-chain amino acid transport system permease protein
MIPFLVNGLVNGSVYGLLALGLVFVYKGSRVLNFAQGEMGMLAAFIVLSLWADGHWPFLLAALAGLLASGATGFLTERLVIRPARAAPKLTVLVATVAVAGILQFVASQIWGLGPNFMPPPLAGKGLAFGQIVLSVPRIVVVCAAAVVSLVLVALTRQTWFGLAVRGVALNRVAAQLAGIDVDHISSVTWTVGAMLSGLAAILIAPLVSFHVFFMTLLLVRALTAALLAGLTSLGGAFAAGVIVGVVESLVTEFASQPGVTDAALFCVIVLVLATRARGLFAAEY